MKKNLRKNKKGFTLVEIIVVLLIIGILLAITIPSIMGYVGKAKDAQYLADARSGYLAAQTLTAYGNAAGKDVDITKEKVAEELGEEFNNNATVQSIVCGVEGKGSTNDMKLKGCDITVKGLDPSKYIHFVANKEGTVVKGTPATSSDKWDEDATKSK